ncbi:hypothetical protein MSAN_00849900 [Mycena sanguinolenta]|uniref:Transmembrane protein n=1 Tax=Mycena sanguinolenta TaxID=230812 RepID=A0A8H7DA34_9AGAR|nr:hypothetical protein MSAN_00849900 [Mycena sanguinolenta]
MKFPDKQPPTLAWQCILRVGMVGLASRDTRRRRWEHDAVECPFNLHTSEAHFPPLTPDYFSDMGLVLAVLWLLSMATQAFSAAIQVGDVQGLVYQCGTLTIRWTGGESPYNIVCVSSRLDSSISSMLRLRTTSVDGTSIAFDVTGLSFEWVVDYPAGTLLVIGVGDNFGDVDVTDAFTVSDSTESSCLSASPTGFNPTTSNSQPTSEPISLPKTINIKRIAGSVGGGVGGVFSLILGWFCCCRRNKRTTEAATPGAMENTDSKPVPMHSSSMMEPGSQMGYMYGDMNQKMTQPATPTTLSQFQPQAMFLPTTQRRDEVQSFFPELGYEQKAATPTMMVANPTPPIQQPWAYQSPAGEQGQTMITTTPDSKTVMSWEPPRSQQASSSVTTGPIVTESRERVLEGRLRALENRVTSLGDAPPSYDAKD